MRAAFTQKQERRKGQSGNPKGRPAGAVDKATEAAGALLDGDAARTRSAIQFATETSDFDGRSLQLEEEQCREHVERAWLG